MSTLMPEHVQEQVIIQIEQNPVQDALDKMIGMVKNGQWCRNKVFEIGEHKLARHCAVGLSSMVTAGNAYSS